MSRIALCDDDEIFSKKLKDLISGLVEFKITVMDFNDADSLLAAYEKQKHPFDLVLLDIVMPLVDGIQAAKEIRSLDSSVVIVFITAFEQFAFPAYQAHPYAYLMKYSAELKQELTEAIRLCQKVSREYLSIQKRHEYYNIFYGDILYIDSNLRKVTVHSTQDCITYYQNISELAEKLKGHGFYQIHRSIIVNLHYIRRIDYGKKIVEMSDGQLLVISHQRLKDFIEFYMKDRGR